jgi:hypothetical protein
MHCAPMVQQYMYIMGMAMHVIHAHNITYITHVASSEMVTQRAPRASRMQYETFPASQGRFPVPGWIASW